MKIRENDTIKFYFFVLSIKIQTLHSVNVGRIKSIRDIRHARPIYSHELQREINLKTIESKK